MQLNQKSFKYLRFFLDSIILIATYLFSVYLLFLPKTINFTLKVQFIFVTLFFVWTISAVFTNLYDEFRSRNFTFEILSVGKNVFIQSVASIVVLFFVPEGNLNSEFIFVYPTFLFFTLLIEKLLLRKFLQSQRRKGRFTRNLLIVGAGKLAMNFYETLNNNPQFGYHAIGFLDDTNPSFLNGLYLGKIEDLDTILVKNEVTDVIIALAEESHLRLPEVIRTCENHTTRVKIIPDYFKFITSKYKLSMFGHHPIITIREDQINEPHWRIIK